MCGVLGAPLKKGSSAESVHGGNRGSLLPLPTPPAAALQDVCYGGLPPSRAADWLGRYFPNFSLEFQGVSLCLGGLHILCRTLAHPLRTLIHWRRQAAEKRVAIKCQEGMSCSVTPPCADAAADPTSPQLHVLSLGHLRQSLLGSF